METETINKEEVGQKAKSDVMDETLKEEIKKLIEDLRQQDSIEIGNSKVGTFKVYFNVDNLEEAKKKIQNAKELLLIARKDIL